MDIPYPREGFKRQWVESSTACGNFVPGYWTMTAMIKPSPLHMWDSSKEEWVSCRQYMNSVGDEIGNEDIQIQIKEADLQKALQTSYNSTGEFKEEEGSESSTSFDFI